MIDEEGAVHWQTVPLRKHSEACDGNTNPKTPLNSAANDAIIRVTMYADTATGQLSQQIVLDQDSSLRACCRQAAEYPCDMCNVVTSSEEQLAVHMDGKRHRKHILMAEVTSSCTADVGADGDELHCELCDVTAPSSTHKQIHLRCPTCLIDMEVALHGKIPARAQHGTFSGWRTLLRSDVPS